MIFVDGSIIDRGECFKLYEAGGKWYEVGSDVILNKITDKKPWMPHFIRAFEVFLALGSSFSLFVRNRVEVRVCFWLVRKIFLDTFYDTILNKHTTSLIIQ